MDSSGTGSTGQQKLPTSFMTSRFFSEICDASARRKRDVALFSCNEAGTNHPLV